MRGICSPLVSRLNIPNFAASRGSVRASMRSTFKRTRRWRAATAMASTLLTAPLPGGRPVPRVTAIKVAPIHPAST
jgi:hypothetical protein